MTASRMTWPSTSHSPIRPDDCSWPLLQLPSRSRLPTQQILPDSRVTQCRMPINPASRMHAARYTLQAQHGAADQSSQILLAKNIWSSTQWMSIISLFARLWISPAQIPTKPAHFVALLCATAGGPSFRILSRFATRMNMLLFVLLFLTGVQLTPLPSSYSRSLHPRHASPQTLMPLCPSADPDSNTLTLQAS